MNTKSFEILENTTLSAHLKSKGISKSLKQEWYNIIIDNKDLLENTDFDGIYHIVQSLAIEGIDDDIVNQTAFTIATDNDIDIDPDKAAKCFMMHSKK